MKPDLLITWIKHTDYPIFRLFLSRYREFFGRIIIYFSEHNRFPYFDHFIQKSLSKLDCIFLDPVLTDWSREDWRNKSTNEMLKYSQSEWVCSIEQDFFCKDWNSLLFKTQEAMKENDLVGWLNPTNYPYVHPAYWFVKRSVLEETSKDFSPHPEINGLDHFGMITKEIIDNGGRLTSLKDMGLETELINSDKTDCFHLGSVNQNYLEGLKSEYVFHRPDWFYIYNFYSMRADVSQDSQFMELMRKIDSKLKLQISDINPETDSRSKFYK